MFYKMSFSNCKKVLETILNKHRNYRVSFAKRTKILEAILKVDKINKYQSQKCTEIFEAIIKSAQKFINIILKSQHTSKDIILKG